MSAIETKKLSIGYSTPVLEEIDLAAEQGQVISILGPNGAGKTTFIKTLSGLISPLKGEALIDGYPVTQYHHRDLARKLSLVLTEKPPTRNLTVWELVSMGRHPYSEWTGLLKEQDKQIVKESLNLTQTIDLSQIKLFELSDGQLQMAMIARAIAQDTDLIVLDEPMAHLDLQNSLEIAQLIKKIAKEGKTVILSSHNWRLCSQISDLFWLFNPVGPIVTGFPEDLIVQGELHKTLHLKSDHNLMTGTNFSRTDLNSFHVTGSDPVICYWTTHALQREGYNVSDEASNVVRAELSEYTIKLDQGEEKFKTLHELIKCIKQLQ